MARTKQQIVLNNFNTMTPSMRTFTPKSQFGFLAANRIDADYFNLELGQYAALTGQYSTKTSPSLLADSNVVDIIQDPTAVYDFFALAYSGNVYSVAGTTVTEANAFNNNSGNAIAYYNNKIVKTYPTGTAFGVLTPGGTSWTSYAGVAPGGIQILQTFGSYLFNGGTADNRIWRIDGSTWTVATSGVGTLNLPTWLAPICMENYNNKYLAIAASSIGYQNNSYTQNYIFLWDSVSPSYAYSIPFPGKIVGMKTIRGILYVLTSDTAGSASLYALSGITPKLIFNSSMQFGVSRVDGGGNRLTDRPLVEILGKVGIISTMGTRPGIYLWDQDKKELSQFFGATDKMLVSSRINTANINIFYGTTSVIYQFNTTTKIGALFVTNTIPLIGQIDSIEVYYDTPPSGGQQISTVLAHEDENNGTVTSPLLTITSSNYQNLKYTILDAGGITCKSVRVSMNSDVLIRKVVINYETNI